jgi:fluoride exporter
MTVDPTHPAGCHPGAVHLVLIAVAGAAGALSRYGIGTAVGGRSFPWSTLGINLAGSFALGFVLRVAQLRDWPQDVTLPIAVGFLGAFTTFSTFSVETFDLLRTDRAAEAAAYVALSVLGGLAAAAAGYSIARSFA